MRRIGIYARVSTEHEAQISALENQIQYYDEILSRHPDWKLIDRYIDEGITGTSVKKRNNFLRMMEDAKNGKLDLIVTREVSRFARNTVDTLQQTRILKSYGVEVWFTEDNIWTMNDEDGELRLSIMATLAQNESKKTSLRVKAGQKISFMNGVPYGNGNILGYNRIGKQFVVNQEQAETVERIFELYLQGNGMRKIQFILEQEGRKRSSGKTTWSASVISRILQNPFYCGRIEYRKQYVPDYLEQKKINNKGEVEKIIVNGNHSAIITEEEFDKVQEKLTNSITHKNGRAYGKPLANNVWVRKVKCKCGSTMNRRVSYKSKVSDRTLYSFQCYNQLRTGTIENRLLKGLSIDGICENKGFQQSKLEIQADFIFRKMFLNKQEIYDTAIEMLESNIYEETNNSEYVESISNYHQEINKLKKKLDILIEMRTDGDISRETFKEKGDAISERIKTYENNIIELQQNIKSNETQEEKNNRLEALANFLKVHAFSKEEGVPDSIIEEFVEEIIVDNNVFHWKLRVNNGNEKNISIDLNRYKKNNVDKLKTMYSAKCSTGSIEHDTLIKKPIFLGTYEISKEYARKAIAYYYDEFHLYYPEKMVVQLELV